MNVRFTDQSVMVTNRTMNDRNAAAKKYGDMILFLGPFRHPVETMVERLLHTYCQTLSRKWNTPSSVNMPSISVDIITNSPLIDVGLFSLPRTCSRTDEFMHVNAKSFITPHTFIKENPRNIRIISQRFGAFEHLAANRNV